MSKLFTDYIQSVSSKFSYEETSEMGYRADFEKLIGGIFESIRVTRIDHDPRSKEGNKPDFVVVTDVPIVYIETKDIGISLDKVEKSRQMARYFGYSNLVLTDYLEFRFYRNGVSYGEPIKIGEYDLKQRTVEAVPKNYELLAKTLLDFARSHKEPIKSGEHLAKIMGGKAQRIRDNIRHFLDVDSKKNGELLRIHEAIREMLVHDLTSEAFSDMYAQTLVYGLFVARYYDDTPDTFSRQEARDLVPASNPFLQHFFDHIAGPSFDKRLSYIVDELCEVFSHADTKSLVEQYMKASDPIIHFYEDFLREYDPDLRKKMGAYYTPLPVVGFIVRSVDLILRDKFKLPEGLADTSKLKNGKHKVQILDPAVGTGTFISAVIRVIYKRLLEQKQKGRWPKYVHNDLLPRLQGFELMMAPYTIAHLKLSLAFRKTGFCRFHRRLGIYLTNSLEQSESKRGRLAFGFAESIAKEAESASVVKNDMPIMVVVGNPPYRASSSNKGKWIEEQIEVYKKDLDEKKINLHDDYIKFIRFAEHFIEKNRTGVVAMITNNSFIDGITHRQMRKHLLETFDEIYILNLHGDTKKREKSPDGGKDENVFNIQQGVSINIFIRKNRNKRRLGVVRHADVWGEREKKYEFLDKADITTVKWEKLNYVEPCFFFVPKDFRLEQEYGKGTKLDEIFIKSGSSMKTERDSVCIQFTEMEMEKVVNDFSSLTTRELYAKYSTKDSRDWKMEWAVNDVKWNAGKNLFTRITYRPFDRRTTFFTGKSRGFIGTPGKMSRQFSSQNIGLLTSRSFASQETFDRVFVTEDIPDIHSASDQTYVFPLYVYCEDGAKISNLNKEFVNTLEEIVGKAIGEDVFDYIYAVLHSPEYRRKYTEFLKIGFPRIPYAKSRKQFRALVSLGRELRKIHLLESSKVGRFVTTYPVSGPDRIERVLREDEKVFINTEQYFGDVSEATWNFRIGNCRPAQKWLKDRRGRELVNTEIEHYQRIIVAIHETIRIMGKIDRLV